MAVSSAFLLPPLALFEETDVEPPLSPPSVLPRSDLNDLVIREVICFTKRIAL